MMPSTHDALVQKAARQYLRQLLARPGVTMVRSGYKKVGGVVTPTPAVVIGVRRKRPIAEMAPGELLPSRLEINGGSVATDVIEATFKALEEPGRITHVRPAPGGVSIGHVSITAGTLSCVVKRNGKPVILSNNHVLAASGAAEIGSAIVQPGTYDGGTEANDKIGTLEDFVPITFETGGGTPNLPECPTAIKVVKVLNWLSEKMGHATRLGIVPQAAEPNLVDAAVAAPLAGSVLAEILAENGKMVVPLSVVPAQVNMAVCKAGRTTGYTAGGTITAIDGAVRVSYGDLGEAVFEQQLVVESTARFSQGGDSGSAVLTMDNHLVGLLFAGDEAGTMTVCCPMTEVFRLLELSL
jgi:hypothetical protein